jgi:hypothetical protein
MAFNHYHFISRWRVKGSCEEVVEILTDLEDFPNWWPSVYLAVETLLPQAHYRTHTKGWLPYSMKWDILPDWTNYKKFYPRVLDVRVKGDFIGKGTWFLAEDGDFVNITYDWEITAQKSLLKYLSFVPGLKLIFAANHRWAMNRGERGLQKELMRRRTEKVALDVNKVGGVNYD